jgi:hypothetical protein
VRGTGVGGQAEREAGRKGAARARTGVGVSHGCFVRMIAGV